jgi:broad specificity phosphatase PhoE
VDDPAGEHPLTATPAPIIPAGLDATLVLVRHGESTYIVEGRFQGQAETPLSPTGLRQAELVGGRLARAQDPPALPIPERTAHEIAHSPLARAASTAEAIERAMHDTGTVVGRRPDPGFLEIGQGQWEGLHQAEIDVQYAAELAAWRRQPLTTWAPGGESLPEVQARVRHALSEVLARLAAGQQPGSQDGPQVAGYHDGRPDHPWSIVVGHDGVFKVALLTLFDIPLDRFWMWSMDLCGITIIELRAGRPVLRAHNLTAHLASLLDEQAREEMEERSRSGAL